jgi:Protein of unknown function (DUF3499)
LEITPVSFILAVMRACAKMRCGREPVAAVSLVYAERRVLLTDLASEGDRGARDGSAALHPLYALQLCGEHVDRVTPPLGWTLRDHRDVARMRA